MITSLQSVNEVEWAATKIAIVHQWMVQPWGGAERVLEAIAELFPKADLFTLFLDRRILPAVLAHRSITESFLRYAPGKLRFRRYLMPLYPIALEQLDLRGYDLIISSESGPAKGVISDAHTCHICYSHSPMRYIWDMYSDYKTNLGGRVGKILFSLTAHYMRMWDVATANRVDWFIANSNNVANRIRKHYRRDAVVIHPPVNVSRGYISKEHLDYYLVLGRLVDYKRTDLAIAACNFLRRPLKIVGDGPEYKRLRRLAGPTVEFTGPLPENAISDAYARCRALLFPGEEDFGLVPVEAQSFGRPVIAFGRGGALETIRGLYGDDFRSGATGLFFPEQTQMSLAAAIRRFEKLESTFRPEEIRANAERFGLDRFKAAMAQFVIEKFREGRAQRAASLTSSTA